MQRVLQISSVLVALASCAFASNDYYDSYDWGRSLQPIDFKCPDSGLFPDPANCSNFYQCDIYEGLRPARVFRQQCAPGTTFSKNLKVCVFPADNERPECSPDNGLSASFPGEALIHDSGHYNGHPVGASQQYQSGGGNYQYLPPQGSSSPHEQNGSGNSKPGSPGVVSSQLRPPSSSYGTSGNSANLPYAVNSGSPSNGGPKKFTCTSVGHYPHPTDCHKFYHCQPINNGQYITHEKQCGAQTAWNDAIKTCDWEYNVPSCRVQTAPSTGSESTGSGSTGTPGSGSSGPTDGNQNQGAGPTTSKPPAGSGPNENMEQGGPSGTHDDHPVNCTEPSTESGVCKEAGFFPHPTNCRKFYRCVPQAHGFNIFYMDCAEGTIFDPAIQNCNWAANIDPPRKCDDSETTARPMPITVSTSKPPASAPTSPTEATTTEKDGATTIDTTSTTLPESTTPKPVMTTPQPTSTPSEGSEATTEATSPTQASSTSSEAATSTESDAATTKPSSTTINSDSQVTEASSPTTEPASTAEAVSSTESMTTTTETGTTEGGTTTPKTDTASTEAGATTTEASTSEAGTTVTEGSVSTTEAVASTTDAAASTTDAAASTTESGTSSEASATTTDAAASTTESGTSSEASATTTEGGTTPEAETSTSEINTTTSEAETTTTEAMTTPEVATTTVADAGTTASEAGTTVTEAGTTTTEEAMSPSSTEAESTMTTTEPSTESSSEPSTESSLTTTTEKPGETSSETPSSSTAVPPGTVPCVVNTVNGDQLSFICPNGFTRHPKYCNLFYQCDISENMEVKVTIFKCPDGTVFDKKATKCVPEDETDMPCESSNNKTRVYREISRSPTAAIEVTNKPLCPMEGHFPHQDGCNNTFFKCTRGSDGLLQGYLYKCPKDFIYWSISRRCERSSRFPVCNNISNKMRSNAWRNRVLENLPTENVIIPRKYRM